TGIGGGLVVSGVLFRGAHGVAAEYGHMTIVPGGRRCACGNRGCWEMYASGRALARDARELAEVSPVAAERLLDLAGSPAPLTGRGFCPSARFALAECGPLAGLIGAADLARRRQP